MTENKFRKQVKKQKEVVHVIPAGKGRELRFAVVDIDGREAGDIRFWEKGKYEDIMLPTKQGLPFPQDPESFLEGFSKLREKLQAE